MKKSNLSEYAIGLDMGTNSIGWSIIEEKYGEPRKFIDCGSRIFIRSVEDKSPTPKNRKRRESRLQRRQVQRRSRRKNRLRNYLVLKGFLPDSLKNNSSPEQELNKLGDPYSIRKKAMDEELTRHEFGRALLHLGSRRGFLSNRKTSFGDLADDIKAQNILEKENNSSNKDNDEKNLKGYIKTLRKEMDEVGTRTLGEYLSGLPRKRNRGSLHDRHTDRAMYKEEFEKIWEKQSELNPEIYHKKMKEELEHIIFFQRPLKLKPDRVGHCTFEPKLSRTRNARLESQQFRYWQQINNLSYDDPETGEIDIPLSDEQKKNLACELEKTKRLSWSSVRKALKLPKATEFNLQKVPGNTKGLKGNTTACDIRKILGDSWDSFSEEKQSQIVEDIISYNSKKGLKKRFLNHWRFPEEEATRLAVVELEEEHSNLSLKATKKILHYLQEGKKYHDAVDIAGYKFSEVEKGNSDLLPSPPWIPNPIVQKALYELRHVINAIIKKYGKPSAVRIEMARDLEMNTKRYKETLARYKKNEESNERAREQYEIIRVNNQQLKLKKNISYQDRLKYRLWEESGGVCIYSGEMISKTTLFTDETEIDHILPYKRSLDDSYMNKVICFSRKNREKGARTPREAFEETEEWDSILSISNSLPRPKKERLLKEDLGGIDEFISNQLTDARYISREAGKYIRNLGCDVSFTKGGATSWLRKQWGLNNLLGDSGEKNREDHRHHAVDATVIALTTRRLYQKIIHQITELQKPDDDDISPDHKIKVDPPLLKLRDTLSNRLGNLIVSHATNRKLTGAFHEETVYGIREGEGGKHGLVVRKMLENMTEKEKGNIVCPVIRSAVERYVWEGGGDVKTAMKQLSKKPLIHPKTRNEICRARVWVSKDFPEDSYWNHKNEEGKTLHVLRYGNIHHVEITRNRQNGKYEGEFITTMEVAKKVRIFKEPIVRTEHGEDWEYITYLCSNDTVSLEENGERVFYRVQKLEASASRLTLRLLSAATLNNKKECVQKSISVLMKNFDMRKESVDVLGVLLKNRDG